MSLPKHFQITISDSETHEGVTHVIFDVFSKLKNMLEPRDVFFGKSEGVGCAGVIAGDSGEFHQEMVSCII